MRFWHPMRRSGWLVALALVVWIGGKHVWRESSEPDPAPATIGAPRQQLAASTPLLPVQQATTLPALVPPPSVRPSRLPRQDVLWQQAVPEAVFARFAEWTRAYRQAVTPAARQALETEGVLLAQERRDELEDLIQTQPARALEWAVPFGVRRALPPPVTGLLETRVSGRGALAVANITWTWSASARRRVGRGLGSAMWAEPGRGCGTAFPPAWPRMSWDTTLV
ncbi:MAG: hypothetical protein AAB676_00200 [Verrucomicrobiota bacterium]